MATGTMRSPRAIRADSRSNLASFDLSCKSNLLTAPYLLAFSPVVSSAVVTSLTGSRSAIGFDGLGRLTTITNPDSGVGTLTIKVTSSSATCVAAGGTARCLTVVVSPAGEIRMCDPSHASTSDSTDPMSCPA